MQQHYLLSMISILLELALLHAFFLLPFPFSFFVKIFQFPVEAPYASSFCFLQLDLQNTISFSIFHIIVLFDYIFFVHTGSLLDVCCWVFFLFAAAFAILALSCSTSGFNLVGFFGLPFCCILFGS